MIKFLWTLAALGSVIGMLLVASSLLLATSAPQEAAAAAMGIGFAVIPTCLALAVSRLKAPA